MSNEPFLGVMFINFLIEYKKFLKEKQLTPNNHIPHYCRWLKKYLEFTKAFDSEPHNVLLMKFLKFLDEEPNIEKGQLDQAAKAVQVFNNQFPEHFQELNKGDNVIDSFNPAKSVDQLVQRNFLKYKDIHPEQYNLIDNGLNDS